MNRSGVSFPDCCPCLLRAAAECLPETGSSTVRSEREVAAEKCWGVSSTAPQHLMLSIPPRRKSSWLAAAAAATQGCERIEPFLSGGVGGTLEGRLGWLLAFFPCLGSGAGAPSAACRGPSLVAATGIADAMQSARRSCWSSEQDESSLALGSALALTGVFAVTGAQA